MSQIAIPYQLRARLSQLEPTEPRFRMGAGA